MPDENKHAALGQLGFEIAKTCSTCVHWSRTEYRAPSSWGRCQKAPYQHAKHNDPSHAGTPAVGSCPSHEQDLAVLGFIVGEDYAARYGVEE